MSGFIERITAEPRRNIQVAELYWGIGDLTREVNKTLYRGSKSSPDVPEMTSFNSPPLEYDDHDWARQPTLIKDFLGSPAPFFTMEYGGYYPVFGTIHPRAGMLEMSSGGRSVSVAVNYEGEKGWLSMPTYQLELYFRDDHGGVIVIKPQIEIAKAILSFAKGQLRRSIS